MGFDIILKSISAEGLVWENKLCSGQVSQDLCTLLIYTDYLWIHSSVGKFVIVFYHVTQLFLEKCNWGNCIKVLIARILFNRHFAKRNEGSYSAHQSDLLSAYTVLNQKM